MKDEKITEDQHFAEEKAELDARYASDPPLKSDEEAILAEAAIDEEYNAQFVKAREEKEKAKKDFRDAVMEIVWNHTTVGNCPRGEWAPEYFVSKKDEKPFDDEFDAALKKYLEARK